MKTHALASIGNPVDGVLDDPNQTKPNTLVRTVNLISLPYTQCPHTKLSEISLPKRISQTIYLRTIAAILFHVNRLCTRAWIVRFDQIHFTVYLMLHYVCFHPPTANSCLIVSQCLHLRFSVRRTFENLLYLVILVNMPLLLTSKLRVYKLKNV